MKVIKFLMTMVLGATAMSAVAQDFSDPRYAKWGETPEQRKENILASSYLKEEVDNHNFNSAAAFLQQLIVNCPAASENIYANGVKLYKQKINRAETLAEKRTYVDSLLWLYDVRLQHFASHPKRGKAYLLERKAREYLTYKDSDREGVAEAFEAAIAAQVETSGVADPEVVAIYFKNICDDYSNDIVDAMTVVNIYDANAKFFENITPEQEEFKKQFETCFATSGAASCENIEAIFSKKLADNPNDEATLSQAFGLLARASCESDFFIQVAEKYYSIKPSSDVAMRLAQVFQNNKNFDKANQYLREALAAETDPAEREKLYVRIGILDMSMNNIGEAVEAFGEVRNLNPDNAYVPYFLAQCYVSGAKACSGLAHDAVYWVAYDLLMKAAPMLEALPEGEGVETAENARKLAATYRKVFPTKEECFFAELNDGSTYVVNCGYARGIATQVRPRE
ncbi:MAG: enzyme of heme biosynthesis [Alistipes sp.]|nr:enzyme of heme biosynthesis [Alistipes sp.]